MILDDQIYPWYIAARNAHLSGDSRQALHFYRRIRIEHSLDLFYEVELGRPVRFVHPMGSVLGRAAYADHLVVYNGVNVGADLHRNRPMFRGPCVLFPGAKVLGRSVIGENVYITANTVVYNTNIPANSVVYPCGDGTSSLGGRQCCAVKPTRRSVIADFFKTSAPPLENYNLQELEVD